VCDISQPHASSGSMLGRRCTLLLAIVVVGEGYALTTTRHRPVPVMPRPAMLVAAVPPPAQPENAQGLKVAWGVCGFLSILASAVGRLTPIALQPFARNDLTLLQWGLYGSSMGLFAYVEGYGAFQKKFSPLVVQRAMTLKQSPSPLHVLLAPFYSMGLMHATRKRKIVSTSISLSVAVIVGVVKRLPYPWRSIVDAGVVTGLTWGGASILAFYVRALCGKAPGVDPQLPNN